MSEFEVMETNNIDFHELRVSIIDRLERYEDLQVAASYESRHPTSERGPADDAVILENTKAELLNDLRQLSSHIYRVEKDLDDVRWRKWMVGPAIELAYHFFHHGVYKLPYCRNWTPASHVNEHGHIRPEFLTYLGTIPLFTVPEAIWSLIAFERKLSKTSSLRVAVEELEHEVEHGSEIYDTRCLKAANWDGVLWHD